MSSIQQSLAAFRLRGGRVKFGAALVGTGAVLAGIGAIVAGLEFAVAVRGWVAEQEGDPIAFARARACQARVVTEAATRAGFDAWQKHHDGLSAGAPANR